MPNWNEVIFEIAQEQEKKPEHNALDTIRRKYLTLVSNISGRNTIAYYSGWLQKPKVEGIQIGDKDKSGFMLTINKLDKTKGLDLILHTPGGDIAATESLVDYLYAVFNHDIRVIVPQLSMSAGTMIAFAAKEIIMGKQSNLGPIDPQIGGIACQGVLSEFEQAIKSIKLKPESASLWQVIISKYHPTFLGTCKQAVEWSEKMVENWLLENMCKGDSKRVKKIVQTFSNHSEQKSHGRHISIKECREAGLNIISLEDNQKFQDAVLTTHHAFMHTFNNTHCVKLIENHLGVTYIESAIPQ